MHDLPIIDSAERLEELFTASAARPVWLFKHSLICGVSDQGLERFARFVAERPAAERGPVGVIEIQSTPDLSRAVTVRTGVRHESPQALLLCEGEVAWHASHWAIDGRSLAGGQAALVERRCAGAST